MGHDNSVLGLASIRRNRGLSLEQISQDTKISVRALQAIESGEFKKLPGGIYNTSYIRQYARAIDAGLRKVVCQDGHSIGEHATQAGTRREQQRPPAVGADCLLV